MAPMINTLNEEQIIAINLASMTTGTLYAILTDIEHAHGHQRRAGDCKSIQAIAAELVARGRQSPIASDGSINWYVGKNAQQLA